MPNIPQVTRRSWAAAGIICAALAGAPAVTNATASPTDPTTTAAEAPPTTDKNGKQLTLWQKLVWQETSRRQQGIGVLGVSFLSKRWRTKKRLTDGVPQVRQNAAIALGTLALPEGFAPLVEALANGPADLRFQAATS